MTLVFKADTPEQLRVQVVEAIRVAAENHRSWGEMGKKSEQATAKAVVKNLLSVASWFESAVIMPTKTKDEGQ